MKEKIVLSMLILLVFSCFCFGDSYDRIIESWDENGGFNAPPNDRGSFTVNAYSGGFRISVSSAHAMQFCFTDTSAKCVAYKVKSGKDPWYYGSLPIWFDKPAGRQSFTVTPGSVEKPTLVSWAFLSTGGPQFGMPVILQRGDQTTYAYGPYTVAKKGCYWCCLRMLAQYYGYFLSAEEWMTQMKQKGGFTHGGAIFPNIAAKVGHMVYKGQRSVLEASSRGWKPILRVKCRQHFVVWDAWNWSTKHGLRSFINDPNMATNAEKRKQHLGYDCYPGGYASTRVYAPATTNSEELRAYWHTQEPPGSVANAISNNLQSQILTAETGFCPVADPENSSYASYFAFVANQEVAVESFSCNGSPNTGIVYVEDEIDDDEAYGEDDDPMVCNGNISPKFETFAEAVEAVPGRYSIVITGKPGAPYSVEASSNNTWGDGENYQLFEGNFDATGRKTIEVDHNPGWIVRSLPSIRSMPDGTPVEILDSQITIATSDGFFIQNAQWANNTGVWVKYANPFDIERDWRITAVYGLVRIDEYGHRYIDAINCNFAGVWCAQTPLKPYYSSLQTAFANIPLTPSGLYCKFIVKVITSAPGMAEVTDGTVTTLVENLPADLTLEVGKTYAILAVPYNGKIIAERPNQVHPQTIEEVLN